MRQPGAATNISTFRSVERPYAGGKFGFASGYPLVPPSFSQSEPVLAPLGEDYLLTWLQSDTAQQLQHRAYYRVLRAGALIPADSARLGPGIFNEDVLVAAGGPGGRALIVSETDGEDVVPMVRATHFCLSNCPIKLEIYLDDLVPILSWNAEANATYTVQFKRQLTEPWQDLQEIEASQDEILQVEDRAALAETMRFYRVARQP